MTRFESPELDVRVLCSAGTYVRVLAADLGKAVGCGAHLGGLRRTRSGPFVLEEAKTFERIEAAVERGGLEDLLVSPEEALGFPAQGEVPGDLHQQCVYLFASLLSEIHPCY